MNQYGDTTCWRGKIPAGRAVRRVRAGFSTDLACLVLSACSFGVMTPVVAHGQALPAATASPISTGFELPTVGGSFSYSVSAYESFTSGFYSPSGFGSSTGLSGDVALVTSSKSDPFSMVLATGRSWSTSGQPSPFYLSIGASQVVNLHKWNAVLSDSVGYYPATPSLGLSGIPGTGDLGVPPVQVGSNAGQGLLTSYSTRLSNTASLGIGRQLTARSSVNVSGSYGILRFLGDASGTGLESDSYSGGAGYSYTLNGRSSLSGNYSYSKSKYNGGLPGYHSQTVDGGYSRRLSRRLSVDVFAGPQWTTIEPGTVQFFPGLSPFAGTSVNLFASAALSYKTRDVSYSLNYNRGTNNGFGALPGGRTDTVGFSASKTFDRVWNGAVNAGYSHTSSFSQYQPFSGKTFIASVQVSRALGRNFSTYGSYSLEKQSSTGSTVGVFNLFSGSFQVASFGLTYSPRPMRIGAH
jgi:hypothetical protein